MIGDKPFCAVSIHSVCIASHFFSLLLWLAVVPRVLSAPSTQILQAWAGVGVVECQVSLGTQLIEWWLNGRQLAAINLTIGGNREEEGNADQLQQG